MARFYRISEIAALCNVTRDDIYKARSRQTRKHPNGKFPNAEWDRFYRRWRIPRRDVESYLWKSHCLRLEDLEDLEGHEDE